MKKPTYPPITQALFYCVVILFVGTFLNSLFSYGYEIGKEEGYNRCISDYKNGTIPESTWYATDDGNSNKTNATGYGAGFELVNETPQFASLVATTPINDWSLIINSPEDEIISFHQNGTIVYKGKTLTNNREVSNAFIDLTLNREQYCDKFEEN